VARSVRRARSGTLENPRCARLVLGSPRSSKRKEATSGASWFESPYSLLNLLVIFPYKPLVSALEYVPAAFPEGEMRNNHRPSATNRQFRPTTPGGPRPNRWRSTSSRPEPKGFQNMKQSYERYLALARAEAQNGNMVAAENYYQHAEHYFRSMFSGANET
jgi:Domain of unknown function (DUF4167)